MEGKRDGWKAALALAPTLIALFVFMIIPIVYAVLMSFMEDFSFNEGGLINFFANSYVQFPSLRGYADVLGDPDFQRALGNTALLVIVSVPLTIIISLMMAVCLNSIKKLQGLYQTIFFLPYVTNSIALGMVFKVIFGRDAGLLNAILGTAGKAWITGGRWEMFAVIVTYTIWTGLAFKVLVFMSGLQSIDKQYYDAARIDGTSRGRIFRKITVPLLSPQILYITITSFIGAFKAYTSVISIFGGGSNGLGNFGGSSGKEWLTVVGYIYQFVDGSQNGGLTKAAAGSVILLIIIMAITGVQFLVSKKRVHY